MRPTHAAVPHELLLKLREALQGRHDLAQIAGEVLEHARALPDPSIDRPALPYMRTKATAEPGTPAARGFCPIAVKAGISEADLRTALEYHGVGPTRSNRAAQRLRAGAAPGSCLMVALNDESDARKLWVSTVFKPWCDRHGLTLRQGLSVVYQDVPAKPTDSIRQTITMRDLFEPDAGAYATVLIEELDEAERAKEVRDDALVARSAPNDSRVWERPRGG